MPCTVCSVTEACAAASLRLRRETAASSALGVTSADNAYSASSSARLVTTWPTRRINRSSRSSSRGGTATGAPSTRTRPAQERPAAGSEFRQIDWLDDVVVGARIEPKHTVVWTVARGDDEDRGGEAHAPCLADERDAVAVGHPEVEQHEVVATRRERRTRLRERARRVDGETFVAQPCCNQRGEPGVIFCEQDAHNSQYWFRLTGACAR